MAPLIILRASRIKLNKNITGFFFVNVSMRCVLLSKINYLFRKRPLIPSIVGCYILILCLLYAVADNIIIHINPQYFQSESELMILLSFEHNLIRYANSNKRKSNLVIVGPSYAAMLGNPFSAHNLGLTGGYGPETLYIIENYCRKKDSILYIINLWESETLSKSAYMEVRPEIKSNITRRVRLLKSLTTHYKTKLFSNEAISSNTRLNPLQDILPSEQLAYIMNNPDAPENWLRRLEFGIRTINHYNSDLDEIADYYKSIKERNSRIQYVFLPCLPLREHPNNSKLNKKIRRIKKKEQRLWIELERRNIELVDLRAFFVNSDYMDLFHLNPKGREKMIACLHDMGYL